MKTLEICGNVLTYLKINDQYFMVFSPEHIDTPPKPVSNAVIMKVDFEEESCQMTSSGDYMYLDYG